MWCHMQVGSQGHGQICISGWDVLILPTILEILHRTNITLMMITHLRINPYAIGILVAEC